MIWSEENEEEEVELVVRTSHDILGRPLLRLEYGVGGFEVEPRLVPDFLRAVAEAARIVMNEHEDRETCDE